MFDVSDLIITRLESSLGVRGPRSPYTFRADTVAPSCRVASDAVTVFETEYAIIIRDRDDNRACTIVLTTAVYAETKTRPTPEQAEEYIPHLLMFQHDRLREYLNTLTLWMGFYPALLIDLPQDLLELTSPGASNPPPRR